MKTVIDTAGDVIARVSDAKAAALVATGQWLYCPKRLHKSGKPSDADRWLERKGNGNG